MRVLYHVVGLGTAGFLMVWLSRLSPVGVGADTPGSRVRAEPVHPSAAAVVSVAALATQQVAASRGSGTLGAVPVVPVMPVESPKIQVLPAVRPGAAVPVSWATL